MEKLEILYPMFSLIVWTFMIAVLMIFRALRAVNNGLNPQYFQYGAGYEIPGKMRAAYLHYSNLFEMPVLFYVAVLTVFTTNITGPYIYWLSWIYVLTRIIHTLISVSDKYLARRRDSFLVSSILLIMLWVEIFNKIILEN